MELTKEMIEEVKNLASSDEIVAFAKERGGEITKEDAEKMYNALHKEGELDDDELDDVSGGAFIDPSSWLGKLIMLLFGRLGGTSCVVSGATAKKTTKTDTGNITNAIQRGKSKGIVSLGELEDGMNGKTSYTTL